MDTNQLLLTIAVTVTTLLIVIVGTQLIFLLRDLRKTIKKTGHLIEDFDKKNHHKPEHTATVQKPKKPALHSIIDKIRILAPNENLRSKKFFIKER